MNPGDLSWEPFKKLGDFTVYDRTSPEQVFERIGDADIVLTNKTLFPAEVLEKLPALRYIGATSTGYNVIDIDAARRQGIMVTNVPEYATYATAQMTIALLLELTNRVGSHDQAVHEGAWQNSSDFCFTNGPMTELWGKTLGLIGYGRIAQRTGRIATALGMRVLANSRSIEDSLKKTLAENSAGDGKGNLLSVGDEDVILSSFDDLLKQSDVISCHCPLTPATNGLICADTIARMKDGVLLINTSRGPVLNEADVAAALRSGKIAGVAVDVLSTEPPSGANPLLSAPNCIITPHIAWAPRETRSRLLQTVYENIVAYLAGDPQNVVS
jgi:glycerate dehydrogenase